MIAGDNTGEESNLSILSNLGSSSLEEDELNHFMVKEIVTTQGIGLITWKKIKENL